MRFEARKSSTYSTLCATTWPGWDRLKARVEAAREIMARVFVGALNYAVVPPTNEAPNNNLFKDLVSALLILEREVMVEKGLKKT